MADDDDRTAPTNALCCDSFAGQHPATRRIYPFLDADPGVYDVCGDDAHLPIPSGEIAEMEPLSDR